MMMGDCLDVGINQISRQKEIDAQAQETARDVLKDKAVVDETEEGTRAIQRAKEPLSISFSKAENNLQGRIYPGDDVVPNLNAGQKSPAEMDFEQGKNAGQALSEEAIREARSKITPKPQADPNGAENQNKGDRRSNRVGFNRRKKAIKAVNEPVKDQQKHAGFREDKKNLERENKHEEIIDPRMPPSLEVAKGNHAEKEIRRESVGVSYVAGQAMAGGGSLSSRETGFIKAPLHDEGINNKGNAEDNPAQENGTAGLRAAKAFGGHRPYNIEIKTNQSEAQRIADSGNRIEMVNGCIDVFSIFLQSFHYARKSPQSHGVSNAQDQKKKRKKPINFYLETALGKNQIPYAA